MVGLLGARPADEDVFGVEKPVGRNRGRKRASTAKPLITCIYCRQLRPSSDEHVLLDGLGGSTTIPWVCGDDGASKGCNHLLGNEIDRPFLRDTPFAIYRLFGEGRTSKRDQFLSRPDLGGHLDLVGDDLLPQVFNPDRWTIVAAQNHTPVELGRLLAELPGRIHHSILPDVASEPTRLVLKDGKLKIRAKSEALAAEFEEKLRMDAATLSSLATEKSAQEMPPVRAPRRVMMNCEPNAPSRCAAKMVFNLLALAFGPELVLRQELDGLRDFIAGRDVQPVETVTSGDGEVGWTMDIRHVSNWLQHERAQVLPSCVDAIVLDHDGSTLFGVIILRGSAHFFVKVAKIDDLAVSRAELPVMLASTGNGDTLLRGSQAMNEYALAVTKVA